MIYFSGFGAEHIPKGIKKFVASKNIITNIYKIKSYDLIMCRYFYIGFIDFVLKDKRLSDYTIFLSPNEYEKNDKTILKYF